MAVVDRQVGTGTGTKEVIYDGNGQVANSVITREQGAPTRKLEAAGAVIIVPAGVIEPRPVQK